MSHFNLDKRFGIIEVLFCLLPEVKQEAVQKLDYLLAGNA